MLVGEFRNKIPRLTLTLPGRGGDVEVTFIMDTGFNGDLTLPLRAIGRLNATLYDTQTHLMANGGEVDSPVYHVEIEWLGETRNVEILALDGNPLLGTGLLTGCHIDIEAIEGGEVIIETL